MTKDKVKKALYAAGEEHMNHIINMLCRATVDYVWVIMFTDNEWADNLPEEQRQVVYLIRTKMYEQVVRRGIQSLQEEEF